MLHPRIQVNIGEPDLAIPLASRGKSSTIPGFQLVAGDYDFHVVILTPSLTLLTELKPHPDGNGGLPNFYKGELLILSSYILLLRFGLIFV